MKLAEVIRAPKVVTDWGKWGNDQMGKAVFPLSKRKGASLRYGRSHRWSLIRFTAVGHSFRLLAAYRQDVAEFKSHLAIEQGTDMTVLCSWEYHGTHPGWHTHACCNEVASITPGLVHPAGMRRLPEGRKVHRLQAYPGGPYLVMNDNAALDILRKRYRLDPDDLLAFKEAP